MKIIKDRGAQGELFFRRISAVPAGAKRQTRNGPIVVGHSETGHHHIVENASAVLWTTNNPLVSVMTATEHCDVVHLRPWDTHETMRLLYDGDGDEVIWEIIGQRQWSPEGWARVED